MPVEEAPERKRAGVEGVARWRRICGMKVGRGGQRVDCGFIAGDGGDRADDRDEDGRDGGDECVQRRKVLLPFPPLQHSGVLTYFTVNRILRKGRALSVVW